MKDPNLIIKKLWYLSYYYDIGGAIVPEVLFYTVLPIHRAAYSGIPLVACHIHIITGYRNGISG